MTDKTDTQSMGPDCIWFVTMYPYTWGLGRNADESRKKARSRAGSLDAHNWVTYLVISAHAPYVDEYGYLNRYPLPWCGSIPVARGRDAKHTELRVLTDDDLVRPDDKKRYGPRTPRYFTIIPRS